MAVTAAAVTAANSEAHKELGQFKALEGKTWMGSYRSGAWHSHDHRPLGLTALRYFQVIASIYRRR
jgi:hypothetical protein